MINEFIDNKIRNAASFADKFSRTKVCVGCLAIDFASLMLMENSRLPLVLRVGGTLLGAFDMVYCMDSMQNAKEGKKDSRDAHLQEYIEINRNTRLPLLVVGAGMLGISSLNYTKNIMMGEPINPAEISFAIGGLSLLGLSTSMYLKN